MTSTRIPESELVRLLQHHQERGFSILYDQYAANLYGIALRIVRSPPVAEDVVQEAFVKAWLNSHAYDPAKGRLFTWLLNIVRNTALDYWRSRQRRMDCHDEGYPDFSRRAIEITDRTAPRYLLAVDHIGLDTLLESLSPDHQLVLEHFYFRDQTHAEAARTLLLPLGTVKTRLRLAIRHLRELAGAEVAKEEKAPAIPVA